MSDLLTSGWHKVNAECEKLKAENTMLKELNREMIGTFQAIYDLLWDRFCATAIRENCKEMIAKAEEISND